MPEPGKTPAPAPGASASAPAARYIMIGGFLGAGKSTAVARLARHLVDHGRRVGLITNDQGAGLVDTVNLRSQGFPVEEIAGGCFCCRFDSLRSAADALTAESRPDVFIAEPVGSCTDLIATVSYPLRRIYGERFAIAPLTVLVDPVRALRILGVETGRSFSSKVAYVYRKQLEEADCIALNKIDAIEADRRAALRRALEELYPHAGIFEISARDGIGLEPWFAHVTETLAGESRPLEIDYDVYAEGEALLGWLNCTIAVSAATAFDAGGLLEELAAGLRRRLERRGIEVAHLKMALTPAAGDGEPAEASDPRLTGIALLSLVRGEVVPELGQRLEEPVDRATLVVNLRAEAPPELLRELVEAEITASGSGEEDRSRARNETLRLDHIECFRPGRPRPTHRMTAPTG